jgi:hypothetical protein
MYSIKRKFTLKCSEINRVNSELVQSDSAKITVPYANNVAASSKLSGLPTSNNVAPV